MKNAPIRVIVALGAITLAGIIFIQVYWVSKAINSQEQQFSHAVQMALRNVVESLCQISGNDVPSNNPIDQVTSNYFIVRTNYRIDLQSLDYLIKGEFEKRNIRQDFEYGVYDCQTDKMVYGDFVPMNSGSKGKPKGALPKLDHEEYYFGVYFPSKGTGLANQLGFWKFTTVLTMVIVIFFGYALFVILRQKRLSEVQRDFINNMTHEFKTPLATLMVSSGVLMNEASSDRQKKYADIVRMESQRLQQHVGQLLETSMLDNHRKTSMVPAHPQALIRTVVRRFGEKQGLQISLIDGPEVVIKVDKLLFENVIFNLLDNAEKYGNGKIEIRIGEEKKEIVIEVRDNGPGIPVSERKKIFMKFYRISKGDLHDVKGFGLGLYFVKQAVRQMRGAVEVKSEGAGSAFRLKFPKVV